MLLPNRAAMHPRDAGYLPPEALTFRLASR